MQHISAPVYPSVLDTQLITGMCAYDRRELKQLALNVHVKEPN